MDWRIHITTLGIILSNLYNVKSKYLRMRIGRWLNITFRYFRQQFLSCQKSCRTRDNNKWHFKARYCDFYCYTLLTLLAIWEMSHFHYRFRSRFSSFLGGNSAAEAHPEVHNNIVVNKMILYASVNADCAPIKIAILSSKTREKRIGIYKYFAFSPAWSEQSRWVRVGGERKWILKISQRKILSSLSISLVVGICVESKI